MHIYELVVLGLLVLGLVLMLKRYANMIGILDIPNSRSEHRIAIPRSGGVAFISAVMILIYTFHYSLYEEYSFVFLAIFIIFCLGLLDDRYNIGYYTKFIVIALATFLVSLNGIVIESLGTYINTDIVLGIFALPFTVFAVVGFSNAFNLIDGLDALASSLAIVMFIAFMLIGYYFSDDMIFFISIYCFVAVSTFVFFNWHPASIFMGDSGSLTLGFIISVLSIKSMQYLPPISLLMVGAIPVIDTIVVILRRLKMSKSIFAPDKCHIHHILKDAFEGHTQITVLFLVCLQMLYILFGLVLVDFEWLIFVIFSTSLLVFYKLTIKFIVKTHRSC